MPLIITHFATIIFFDPLLNTLIFLYRSLGLNMGLAIIALTLVFRLAIFPLNLRSLISQRRIQHLKPHLDALKDKHAQDKGALAQAQMDLYKTEGVNPAGGCVYLLIQLPFLFAMYRVLDFVVKLNHIGDLNSHLYTPWLHLASLGDLHLLFGWVNLGKPDPLHILPILAGVTQFAVSKMTLPVAKAKEKAQDKQEKVSMEESLMAAQGQMVYLFPVMTTVITWGFPSGLALYWTVGNLFSIIQQFYVNRRHPAPTHTLEGTVQKVQSTRKERLTS